MMKPHEPECSDKYVEVFLGEDLLAWMVLALGGALAVGNLLAVLRPPPSVHDDGDLEKAPIARTGLMIVVGSIASLWAIASLLAG
ncbi:MAG: hypothetical protein EXQ63_05230 [Ilumatobacteraceae bacterium]|nr:hypothetical protein [Ilumatobacteraceae bacterium]